MMASNEWLAYLRNELFNICGKERTEKKRGGGMLKDEGRPVWPAIRLKEDGRIPKSNCNRALTSKTFILCSLPPE